MTQTACFPEPTHEDLRWGRHDPDQMGWLERSTRPQAQRIRRFLNANLAELPADAAVALCRRFRTDPWRQVYFELVVGRFLQLLGASLEYEPAGPNGRKVDWFATFTDGAATHVEATSPRMNAWIEQGARARGPLLQIIEAEAHEGWSVIISSLPALGSQESRAEFRRAVRTMMAELPDAATAASDERLDRVAWIPEGEIELGFRPGRYDGGAIIGNTGGAGWDDCTNRIAGAVRNKRYQARAFPGRVVLAIDAPDCDREDADVGLFGSTYQILDPDLRQLGPVEFRPNGSLAVQKAAEYPAVFVFNVGMFGGPDPSLYYHPRFVGELPTAFDALEQHRLADGAITRTPALVDGILAGLDFPERE